uniref:Uncharacterized protein n=2 Tax=Arabidopsis thaliana TaxID=3702 RepID=Q1G3L3_ARATH|nr:unknown protein [Arabidopsis thaliana]
MNLVLLIRDADILIKPNQKQTNPAGTSIKPITKEHFGEPLPNWSLNQAEGVWLIIHQQINPKKTNDDLRRVNDQRAESPYCGDMTVALFFPYLGFVPMGLPRKVFNESTYRLNYSLNYPLNYLLKYRTK